MDIDIGTGDTKSRLGLDDCAGKSESIATQEARDITSYGGWEEFLIEDR